MGGSYRQIYHSHFSFSTFIRKHTNNFKGDIAHFNVFADWFFTVFKQVLFYKVSDYGNLTVSFKVQIVNVSPLFYYGIFEELMASL